MAGGKSVTGLGVGKSDEWMTPPCIFDALGERFDLDVAAPVNGPLHVPTLRWLSTCGLEADWDGFIWMNPPFGGRNGLVRWMDKFFDHGDGIALTPDRASALWFQAGLRRADAVLLCRRTPFLLPDGSKSGSPAFGTALWAAGSRAFDALFRAERNGLGTLMITVTANAAVAARRMAV